MWTANRYISGKVSDGGKTRILTLSLASPDPVVATVIASTNEEKSHMLAKLMFLLRPANCPIPDEEYDDQLPLPCNIREDQIRRHIDRLSPYKAPGVDRIPNVVLKRSADIILPFL